MSLHGERKERERLVERVGTGQWAVGTHLQTPLRNTGRSEFAAAARAKVIIILVFLVFPES